MNENRPITTWLHRVCRFVGVWFSHFIREPNVQNIISRRANVIKKMLSTETFCSSKKEFLFLVLFVVVRKRVISHVRQRTVVVRWRTKVLLLSGNREKYTDNYWYKPRAPLSFRHTYPRIRPKTYRSVDGETPEFRVNRFSRNSRTFTPRVSIIRFFLYVYSNVYDKHLTSGLDLCVVCAAAISKIPFPKQYINKQTNIAFWWMVFETRRR